MIPGTLLDSLNRSSGLPSAAPKAQTNWAQKAGYAAIAGTVAGTGGMVALGILPGVMWTGATVANRLTRGRLGNSTLRWLNQPAMGAKIDNAINRSAAVSMLSSAAASLIALSSNSETKKG